MSYTDLILDIYMYMCSNYIFSFANDTKPGPPFINLF